MSRIVQQINLYQPVFRRQEVVFSSSALFRIVLVFVFALSFYQGIGWWQQAQLEMRQQELADRKQILETQLESLRQRIAAYSDSGQMEKELGRLQLQITADRRIWQFLEKTIDDSKPSMSEYFAGLARHTLNGLWLTAIQVGRGGDTLGIRGRVTTPELVPQLLGKLRQETVFSGRSFRILHLDRPEQAAQMDFHLLTADAGIDETVQ